jgi:hypothetical protein
LHSCTYYTLAPSGMWIYYRGHFKFRCRCIQHKTK